MNTSVNELQAQINALEAKKQSIIDRLTSENEVILHEEILNLIDCVGEGFVPGDCYAGDRYYSKIEGVKNIRFCNVCEFINVKVESQSGYLLPDKINVRGKVYEICFTQSNHFDSEVDY